VSALSVVAFVFLGVGLLLAEPDRGVVGTLLGNEPGGLMARWLLLAAAVTLPVLGGVRLAGQAVGLYSASSGVGVMVIASLAMLVGVVSFTAGRLNALGRQRSSAWATASSGFAARSTTWFTPRRPSGERSPRTCTTTRCRPWRR
jgi:hypothetical protein